MTAAKGRRSSPDKADRLALRISAKDKFALELLAQKKGTTVSALILDAIRVPLEQGLTIIKREGGVEVEAYIPDEVYDPLEPDRIVKLALIAPEFLSDLEQVIWKVIQEDPAYTGEDGPKFKAIRDRWESIKSTADDLLKLHSS
ncbi:hypothetical protein DESUT3_23830 [Desulfuromonas versatilis]|uniref:Ribbon-helix-helix protein CopG domain-containing protein n=1 Tax=Desulfuromonas versatilis TaxID=2802975 RepID=A0ABN6E1G5_9BACT|nr:hypothetical protein [Desulfuromonas versatilis]BCR05314.1 hypothetical protein DESUT3_23830 [Desulfuromonas versatilis]